MNEKKMQNVIERIKKKRQSLGFSYQDLANKTGISKSTLQRYETGFIKNLSIDKLEILAQALNTTPSYLMGWEKDERLIEKRSFKKNYICKYPSYINNIKDMLINVLSPKLLKEGWNIELCKKPSLCTIIARKDNVEWFIKYIHTFDGDTNHFKKNSILTQMLFQIYGRLAMFNISPISKFTIVVSNEQAFNHLLKYIPGLLKINVSIMLVDLEKNTVLQEHILTEAEFD